LAHVEERSKQELAAGIATVLRVGGCRVAAPDDHCLASQIKVRDGTDNPALVYRSHNTAAPRNVSTSVIQGSALCQADAQ